MGGNASHIWEHFSFILWNKACLLTCNSPRRQWALTNKPLVSKSLPEDLRIRAAFEFCDYIHTTLSLIYGSFCASKCSILFCRSRCHHKSSPSAAPFQVLNQQKADSLDNYSQVDGNRLSITFGSDQRSCAIMESSFITMKSLDGV